MTYGTLKECKIHKHYGLKLDTTSLVYLYIQESSRHRFFCVYYQKLSIPKLLVCRFLCLNIG